MIHTPNLTLLHSFSQETFKHSCFKALSATQPLQFETYSKSLITMIIAWSTIIKPIQFTNDLLTKQRGCFQNNNSSIESYSFAADECGTTATSVAGCFKALSATQPLQLKTYSKSLITMIIAWSTIIKPIQFYKWSSDQKGITCKTAALLNI